MASIVRSSVRTKSGTEQVAEPSSDRAMRFNLSPEQADPPSSCSLQACLTPPVEDSVRSDLRLMLKLGPDQNMMLPPSLLVTLPLRIAQCFSRWVASTWEPSRLIFYFNVLSLTGVARMVSIVRASNEHLPQCGHLIDAACRVPRAQETIGPTRFSPTPGGVRSRLGWSTTGPALLIGDHPRCL